MLQFIALLCLILFIKCIIGFHIRPTTRVLNRAVAGVERKSSSLFPRHRIPLTSFILQCNSNKDEEQQLFTDLRTKLKGTCVYLIGMMGSGKSTVGKVFAEKLGYRFIDTDEVAEFMIEMPIADFFAAGKVNEFRDIEYQVLMDLAQYTRVVVATGGGIIEKNENWGLLRHGIVVFIDMPPVEIYDRLMQDSTQIAKRPLLRESDPLEKLNTLLEKRVDKYTQADVTVTIDKTMGPNTVANMVANGILDTLAKNPPVWEDWKKKREEKAIEIAMNSNPIGVANSGVFQGDGASPKGSVQYVNLSDIKSGKVRLPDGASLPPELIEGLPKPQYEEGDDSQIGKSRPPARGFGASR